MMERMGYLRERVRCRHTKVYSGEVFPLVDRWFWVCSECLETGSDHLKGAPEADPQRYWHSMRRLKPDCWVPASYR
jgi:hypothetical protein